ncbi:MAG: hypothetical protein EXS31_17380 [Pedosphaera sp.]|nr:hypothetical protein [Pedosphaera sp.]
MKDWDGLELAQRHPAWAKACFGIRGTATNHFMGEGWWAWVIPLKDGDFSIGVVFDQRFVTWPEGGSVGQRPKDFLCRHPAGREILEQATWIEDDVHWRRNLAYKVSTRSGDGFVLTGDAAGFMDPFYSLGMDWLTFTTMRAVDLIAAQQTGKPLAAEIERYNRDFEVSYDRWFDAIYRDKNSYFGEYDLMRLAFLMDLGFYYLGVAAQPYRRGESALRESVFTTAPSIPFFHLMRTYNRRFAAIARQRQRRGATGRLNTGRRFLFGGFTFSLWSGRHLVVALASWGWLELTEGWRSWWRTSESKCPTAILPSMVGKS